MRIPFYAAIVTYSMITIEAPVSALNMRSDEIAMQTATGLQDSTTYTRQGLSLMQTAEMAEMDRIADLELAQDQNTHFKEIPDEVLTGAQTISESTFDPKESILESDETLDLAQQEFQWYGSG